MSVSQGATNSEAGLKGKVQASKANWDDVRVRPFSLNDVEAMLEFFYRSPRDSVVIQSINFELWPKENEYRRFLNDAALHPGKMPMLAVEFKGRTIGVHTLINVRGNQADFQAHFWNGQDCGKGIGAISWYKACRYFFDNYMYDTIYFRAPKENALSLAAVKKLPLSFVGEEDLPSEHFKPNQRARVYRLTRKEFNNLNSTDEDETDL